MVLLLVYRKKLDSNKNIKYAEINLPKIYSIKLEICIKRSKHLIKLSVVILK